MKRTRRDEVTILALFGVICLTFAVIALATSDAPDRFDDLPPQVFGFVPEGSDAELIGGLPDGVYWVELGDISDGGNLRLARLAGVDGVLHGWPIALELIDPDEAAGLGKPGDHQKLLLSTGSAWSLHAVLARID